MKYPVLYSLCIIASLGWAAATQANETVGKVYFKVLEVNQPLNLLSDNGTGTQYQSRNLSALMISGFTAPDGKSLQVEMNGKPIGEIKLSNVKPDSATAMTSVTLKIPSIRLQDIKTLSITAQSQSLIGKVSFNFDGDLALDLTGDSYRSQLDRLETLSQQNLFDVNNLGNFDVLTRVEAVTDLAQYPSNRAYQIAAACFDFHGTWVDYDLKRKSLDVIKQMLQEVRGILKEDDARLLDFMDLLYSDEHYEIREVALYEAGAFKTASPLGMILRSIGDSFRSFNPDGRDLLTAALTKPGANEAIAKLAPFFHQQLKQANLCGDNCEAEQIWISEGMLQALKAFPQPGYFALIVPFIEKDNYYSDQNEAAYAILDQPKLTGETAPFIDAFAKVITEAANPNTPGAFSNTFAYRKLAATALTKVKDPRSTDAIKRALLIPGIEPEIVDVLKKANP